MKNTIILKIINDGEDHNDIWKHILCIRFILFNQF